MGNARQDYDNLAWDLSDGAWDETRSQLQSATTFTRVLEIAQRHVGRPAKCVKALQMGGYNVLYRIEFEDGGQDVMFRAPVPHLAQFPDEKTLHEVATMKLLQKQTQMPVPLLLGHGYDCKIGSYLIMPYINHSGDMADVLRVPADPSVVPVLRDDISEDSLRRLYTSMAMQLIYFSRPSFTRIGSLREVEGSVDVAGRPVTQNMNNMIQLANIPRAVLPEETTTYATADEWYIALAELHMVQLIFQHNDLVKSEEDCRNKYVARVLFRNLAKQGKLSRFGFSQDNWSAQSKTTRATCDAPSASSGFRLWCDDLRPVSFLVDDQNDILAAIDWEFTYAAPTQFALDPPWWLLLEMPEMWEDGIDDWTRVYSRRLETWLSSMKEAEPLCGASNAQELCLSRYMQESWDTGRFWLTYAARKSWAFDTVFWKYLDERFFGKREEDLPFWKARLHLLGEKETKVMDDVVAQKMEETKERILVDWGDEAKARLQSILQ